MSDLNNKLCLIKFVEIIKNLQRKFKANFKNDLR